MNKFSKLFISGAMLLIISFSTVYVTASAATLKYDRSDELISIQEYEDAMHQVYAQYGIEWKVVDSSDAKPITKALFESEIARARAECKEYQAALTKNKAEFMELKGNISESSADNNVPMVMPVTANYYLYFDINFDVFAHCRLYAKANATYDADKGIFMYTNSSSLTKITGVNCDSWSDDGSTFFINETSRSLYVHILGKAYFSYTIPVINVKVDKTIPVNYYFPWSVYESNKDIYESW